MPLYEYRIVAIGICGGYQQACPFTNQSGDQAGRRAQTTPMITSTCMCVNNAHQGFQSLFCRSQEGPGDHVGLPCDASDRKCTDELKHTCAPPFWIEFGAKPLSSILRCMYRFLASNFSGAPACSMLFPKTCKQFTAQIELATLTTAPP